jgi:hypothetical protein
LRAEFVDLVAAGAAQRPDVLQDDTRAPGLRAVEEDAGRPEPDAIAAQFILRARRQQNGRSETPDELPLARCGETYALNSVLPRPETVPPFCPDGRSRKGTMV